MIRSPVVSGQFYPGSRASLSKEMQSLISPASKKEDAIAMISPHAGYMYSGGVAGALFGSVKAKDVYIILGPNHTGLGKAFGISTAQAWKTPLGDVEVNRVLVKTIEKNCPYIQDDDLSHSGEHSIEVQLPFLQTTCNLFTFVPIVVSQADLNVYIEAGISIAKSIKMLGLEKRSAIIASSDMTHYETRESAEKKDGAAIEAILKLDETLLYKRVNSMDITMCGFAPAIMAIACAKELGAKNARLVKYANSGDASGDYSSVVGYAAITIY